MKHLLLCLLMLLGSTPSFATNLSERSPVYQGLWWEPSRPGQGFEVRSLGNDIFVVWYTYERSGEPVWYTAQGTLVDNEVRTSLRKFTRAEGRSSSSEIGSLVLKRFNPEQIELSWTLPGTSVGIPSAGTWNIRPYLASGATPEIDRSAIWWNPEKSGFGVGISDTLDYRTVALYVYDDLGQPVWMFGTQTNDGALKLAQFSGSCPGCVQRPAQIRSEHAAGISFEGSQALRLELSSAPVAAEFLGVGQYRPFSRTGYERPADRALAKISNRNELIAHLSQSFDRQSAFCEAIAFSPAPSAREFSALNVQENGVDEASTLRTNGEYVYAWDEEQRLVRVLRYGEQTVRAETTFKLSNADTSEVSLYLMPERLVAVAKAGFSPCFGELRFAFPQPFLQGKSLVEIYQLTDPSRPSKSSSLEFSGHILSTRRIGNQLYVISRTALIAPQDFDFSGTPQAQLANQRLLASLDDQALLPSLTFNGSKRPLVTPDRVYVPPLGPSDPKADFAIVTRIPLDAPQNFESIAVLGSIEALYVSTQSVVLATSKYSFANSAQVPIPTVDVHWIDLRNNRLGVIGSGSVEGNLSAANSDQMSWRFSEQDGVLRVVTSGSHWGARGSNRLSLLRASPAAPGMLSTLSYLPNEARPQVLGKPNEQLFGTRFIGNKLYAVTFKRTDPLYAVDLSDPRDPKITGELEIPGFSSYLHPIAEDVLLGIGKTAVDAGPEIGDGSFAWYQGVKLSLFDVSGTTPRELQSLVIGKRGSDTAVSFTHQAFSELRSSQGHEFAFPVRVHDGSVSNPRPDTYYPFKDSGLMRFRVLGQGAQTRFEALSPMLTNRAPQVDFGNLQSRRSILFDDGTLYLENGKLYLQKRGQSTVEGPF